MEIDWFEGPPAALRSSFELAESSAQQLDSYIELGRVLVARREGAIIGHVQLIDTREAGIVEIKNIAVAGHEQGKGIGRALVERAIADAVSEGRERMVVSTAAADTGNLRFYQRCGFRMLSIDRDAFVPETGYPEPIVIDGIELRDRVWLSWDL